MFLLFHKTYFSVAKISVFYSQTTTLIARNHQPGTGEGPQHEAGCGWLAKK
jgi:hypothetical protein